MMQSWVRRFSGWMGVRPSVNICTQFLEGIKFLLRVKKPKRPSRIVKLYTSFVRSCCCCCATSRSTKVKQKEKKVWNDSFWKPPDEQNFKYINRRFEVMHRSNGRSTINQFQVVQQRINYTLPSPTYQPTHLQCDQ